MKWKPIPRLAAGGVAGGPPKLKDICPCYSKLHRAPPPVDTRCLEDGLVAPVVG